MGVLTIFRSAESGWGTYTALVLVAGSIRCAPSLNTSTLLRSQRTRNIMDLTLQNIEENLCQVVSQSVECFPTCAVGSWVGGTRRLVPHERLRPGYFYCE